MNKKIIIIPKDKESEKLLDFDNAKPEQLLELRLNKGDFEKLYEEGVFDLINEISNSNIDDYENEEIKDIAIIKKIIDQLIIKENSVNNELKNKVSEIRKLFEEALRREVGVYFYF